MYRKFYFLAHSLGKWEKTRSKCEILNYNKSFSAIRGRSGIAIVKHEEKNGHSHFANQISGLAQSTWNSGKNLLKFNTITTTSLYVNINTMQKFDLFCYLATKDVIPVQKYIHIHICGSSI